LEKTAMRRLLLCLSINLMASAALADAIDGDWCNDDGSHLRIDGPKIELGSGQSVDGNYSRHAFSYVAPPGDPEAGVEIRFKLSSEELMRRLRNPDVMPEHADLWRRCQTTS
jgi:hypothetical protein